MNTPKWIVAHFSPTGGTKKVADAIAAGFGTPVVEMDLTKADCVVSLGEKDAVMAVLPVYGGRVPQVSVERLAALKGNGQKAVAVVVYGNREFDDALLETRNALEANGFCVVAAAAFIAEHSVVRSIAAGRPDAQDEALCRQFAACVLENMLIAATSLGIDNIIHGGGSAVVAQSEELMQKLGIPEGYKPALCASFGYAVEETPAKNHAIAVNRV